MYIYITHPASGVISLARPDPSSYNLIFPIKDEAFHLVLVVLVN